MVYQYFDHVDTETLAIIKEFKRVILGKADEEREISCTQLVEQIAPLALARIFVENILPDGATVSYIYYSVSLCQKTRLLVLISIGYIYIYFITFSSLCIVGMAQAHECWAYKQSQPIYELCGLYCTKNMSTCRTACVD